MNWSKISSHYQVLLKTALMVQRHAVHVADIKTANVKPEFKKALLEGVEPIQRQLARLEKGEFRIAVVGLEKSGKSSFVNAWLESDLLPTARKRCTYTTTQIYSVLNTTEQRVEIISKTQKEFNEYLEELKIASKRTDETATRAKEDIDTIEQHHISLNNVLSEGNKSIPFVRIDDIADYLKKYVADVSVAHAIKEVRLYTTSLSETGGIVFFDVPGLNSGLGKHLDESKNMLADCDAVICVQDSRRPSLESHEQKLVEFVYKGDEAVGISGKLFVFAGQVDLLGTAEDLKEIKKEICQEWDKRGSLPDDHIIFGSAGAYLLIKGCASDEMCISIGKTEDVSYKIGIIKGVNDLKSKEEIIKATGIPKIRARIKHYLNKERAEILKKRCDDPIKRIMITSSEIYRNVSRKFSENPDEVRRKEANKRRIEFQKWWSKRWSEIEPAINRFFQENFDSENKEDKENEIESIKQFRIRYEEIVRDGLSQLPSLKPEIRQDIFDKKSRPVFDALIVNDAWREILYDKDVHDFLHDISEKLSIDLLNDFQKFVNYMTSQLWDSIEVSKYIFNEKELKLQLESGLRSLFLRFARPTAEALIRAPIASDRRKEIVRKLGSDIELLDNYYEGSDPAFGRLKLYVKYGQSLIENPLIRQAVLGIENPVLSTIESISKSTEAIKPRIAMTKQEVIEEVESDINAFEKYLIEVVFTAAGFSSFLYQELKRLRDQFASISHVWAGIAINEYEAENPKLLNELPSELKAPIFDVEISEHLRQLRLAIEDAKDKGL